MSAAKPPWATVVTVHLGNAIAQTPGGQTPGVTLAHYIQPAADLAAKQRRVEAVLAIS